MNPGEIVQTPKINGYYIAIESRLYKLTTK